MRFYFKKHTENKIYLFIFYLYFIFNTLIILNVFYLVGHSFNYFLIIFYIFYTFLYISIHLTICAQYEQYL